MKMIAARSVFLLVTAAFAANAAPARDPLKMKDPDWVDSRFNEVEHGRFFHYSYAIPKRRTPKGIAIKLGPAAEATVCFDTLNCVWAAAWTGGFVEFSSRRFGFTGDAKPDGKMLFQTAVLPGVAMGEDLSDPRERITAPLPAERARYEGLYRNGQRTVLEYTLLGARVLDHPWVEKIDGATAITHTLQIAPAEQELILPLASGPDADRLHSRVTAPASIARLGRHLVLRVPASPQSRVIRYALWPADGKGSSTVWKTEIKPVAPLTHTGFTRLWDQPLTTRGRVGLPLGPFAIDTITLPFKNPWKALFFAGGHDFLPNGDALLATAHGDVWLVRGIDASLREISWTRFATGLYQPLGLKVVEGRIYVLGKDQITELRDLNGDGEADHYRNFCNLSEITGGGHNYATCLETDPEGNFWFIRCNDRTPHGGTLLKVSPDGRNIEVFATGFRNPNGMGVSPEGIVTAADQQGTWVPETRLDICRKGGFYGFVPSSKRPKPPTRFDGPLCWIPRVLDNSAGGQTWVPEGLWGPLSGQMIHISYGRCAIMAILRDTATGGANGGIVPLPGRFESGVMRGRFHRDGHLYLSGLKGWQTVGLADGAFQRVRYTGRNLFIPVAFATHRNGLLLRFNEPLKKDLAEDLGSYNAEMWNYLWSEKYGSDDWSVLHPDRKGRDPLPIKSARLLEDGRSVFLEIPGIRPAHQVALQYNLTSTRGLRKKDTFYFTINQLGPRF